jgi:CheY-like chemotaxis protein
MTSPEGFNTHDIRILIAEDDDDDLFLFKELIFEWADWDYYTRKNTKVAVTVDSAPTQDEILKCLEESQYDLFFLDYHLGEWNGLDIIKDVRAKGH